METSGLVAEKFCRKLTYTETCGNQLSIPSAFCRKYDSRLLTTMDLRVRNGYAITIQLDKIKYFMKGLQWFFKHFDLKGVELLLFEYFGRQNFNVYILGENGSEIRYPDMFKYLPDPFTPQVTVGEAGWRFVVFIRVSDHMDDGIIPPSSFLVHCGSFLPNDITFVLSNGKKFQGSYSSESCKITGLRTICDIVGVPSLSCFHMLLFDFDGHSVIKISAFDEEIYELVFPGSPLSAVGEGGSSHSYEPVCYFEITVEPKHMSDDCYIVEISNEFRTLCQKWGRSQSINVFSGSGCWMLDIRKRDNYYCYTIVDGWQLFRDGLGLDVGDLCVFECPLVSFDQFSVRVVKNVV